MTDYQKLVQANDILFSDLQVSTVIGLLDIFRNIQPLLVFHFSYLWGVNVILLRNCSKGFVLIFIWRVEAILVQHIFFFKKSMICKLFHHARRNIFPFCVEKAQPTVLWRFVLNRTQVRLCFAYSIAFLRFNCDLASLI